MTLAEFGSGSSTMWSAVPQTLELVEASGQTEASGFLLFGDGCSPATPVDLCLAA